nr:hypothetical protein Iba_chr04dCG7740 [Ipomoea batatas]
MPTNENQLFISYLLSPAFQFHSTLSPSSPHFFPDSTLPDRRRKSLPLLRFAIAPHPLEDESLMVVLLPWQHIFSVRAFPSVIGGWDIQWLTNNSCVVVLRRPCLQQGRRSSAVVIGWRLSR